MSAETDCSPNIGTAHCAKLGYAEMAYAAQGTPIDSEARINFCQEVAQSEVFADEAGQAALRDAAGCFFLAYQALTRTVSGDAQ